ncbi:MAG: D-alanine--D-alanine ligase [Blastocatellia bacterium]|nr:D-alanine--D-alanine ligase [Blastocatellia bacterium]
MPKKLRIGVIFGGRSGEHEVSLRSAESILKALDKRKYEVVPIGITPQGKWLTSGEAQKLLPKDVVESGSVSLAMLGDPTQAPIVRTNGSSPDGAFPALDVLFPVLHGTYGEDGTIQGLFEMANIPYVGCGVLASACGMDKIVMKQLFRQADLPIVDFTWFTRTAWERDPKKILNSVVKSIGFPAFVKPANLGSSVGISKAHDRKELETAIAFAAKFDRKIIVEKGVLAREIEVSVLGNDEPTASLPGEIVAGAEFYDYKDKYINNSAQFMIPAKLPAKLIKQFQQMAVRAFQSIDGAGLARVDFFLEHETNRILVNELNTLPGFTSISMYPKLWEASGISYGELLDRLIQLALERHQEKSRSVTHFETE